GISVLWNSVYSDSGGGAGETSPAAKKRVFWYHTPAGLSAASQAVWEGRARRLVEQQSRQRPLRLPQQESTQQPERQHRLSGGVAVCPRSSAPSSGPAAGRGGATVYPCRSRSGNTSRSAQVGLPAEAKEEEQRQTGLVR